MKQPDLTRRSCLSLMLATGVVAYPSRAASKLDLSGAELSVWHYKGAVADFFDASHQLPPPYALNPVDVSGGSMVINSYKAGALDYAFMSQVPALFAAQNTCPFKLVAAVQGDLVKSGLLVSATSSIQSIEDLKGKKIGYIPATSDHYYLLRILQDHHLTLADIVPVSLTASMAKTAFLAGHLDGLIASSYVAELLIEQANARWLVSDADDSARWLSYFAISARTDALADPLKRLAITDYLKREQRTWNWIEKNPESYAKIMAQETGVSEKIFRKINKERRSPVKIIPVSDSIIAQQQSVADAFLNFGFLKKKVLAASLWDHSLSNSIREA